MRDFNILFEKFAPKFSIKFQKTALKIGFNIYLECGVIRVNLKMPKGRKVLFSSYI